MQSEPPSLLLGDGAVAVTSRSIRDPAQGIYEYLEERHEEQGVKVGCYLFPVRLSGWILRREGRLTKHYKRRFCVFDAATDELSVFSDDNTAGKPLRRLVVSKIEMTTQQTQTTVGIIGYERSQELGKEDSDRIASRRTWSGGSVQLPGEQQRFYKAQHEHLSNVSEKQAIVWSHCFRHHMKNHRRRRRAARLAALEASGGWDTVDEDELEELLDDAHDDDVDIEPEFSFHEQRVEDADFRGGRRGQRQEPHLIFDDESDVRISTSARFTSLNANSTGTTTDGFPSRPMNNIPQPRPILPRQSTSPSMRSRTPSWKSMSSSESTDQLAMSANSINSAVFLSQSVSIWDDDELLSHRVEHDAVKPTRLLSTGAFGDVWLAHYHAQTIAVKKLKPMASINDSSKARERTRQFMHEIRVLSRLDHERVVVFVGVAWTMESDVQLLMEYLPYGDLRSYLKYLAIQREEKQKKTPQLQQTPSVWTAYQWRLAVDIAEGLVYLHSLHPQLVHCDLKSRNLLLNSDLRVKIADFGLARWIAEPDSDSEAPDNREAQRCESSQRLMLGTGRWIAPELLAGSGEYAPAVDVYSFGVVLSEIDTSEVPFHDRVVNADGDVMSEDVLLHHVMADAWTPSFSDQCPPEVKAIAEQCMAFHPEHRPSSLDVAHRLRKAMAHAKQRGHWK